jgi:hypothetical protein
MPRASSRHPTLPTRAIVQATRGAKQAARCTACKREHERRKRARRDALDQWVAIHGPLCVGYGNQPPHMVTRAELTYDHATPIAAGGDPRGPGIARCRPCNAARGANP